MPGPDILRPDTTTRPELMSDKASILVVDDEELIRWSIGEHLRGEGFTVIEAEDGDKGFEAVEAHSPDLVLTDLRMPRVDGFEFMRRVRASGRDTPFVVLTANGEVDAAVRATRLGAAAYLTKPFDVREVGLSVQRALEDHRLQHEVRYLRGRRARRYGDIIGEAPAMKRLFTTLDRLSEIDAPTVLLIGESGVGKDLVANALHDNGPRKSGPMMDIDCASLPEQLVESELFGHERGAFTDAKQTKKGLFEVAKGGTVFLDEIGEMSLPTQAKFLRALENRRFKRVGGTTALRMDAGVIAATNRDLEKEVEQGGFRQDLYFRLNVVRVEIPALRERREDIPALVDFFVTRFNEEFRREVGGFSASAMKLLTTYPWPGNVRELRNVVERIVILEPHETILAEHLPPEIRWARPGRGGSQVPFVLPESGVVLEEVESSLVRQALERTDNNQSAAARLLGISRYALRNRMEKFGLS